MQRYVALLRAINVGGHAVKMDRLRALFSAMGFGGVETFIASGNVIFESADTDAAALEGRIERQLQQALGYPVATFLRRPAELAAVAAHQPFGGAEPPAEGALFVLFLKAKPAAGVREKLVACCTENDEVHVHGRELYWRRRVLGMRTIDTGARLERALAAPATARGISTVRRLAAKFAT